VTTDPRWTDRHPDAPVAVEVRRRSRSASYSVAEPAAATIHIRAGSWDGPTVIHELAHLAVAAEHGSAAVEPHGAEFREILLDLVRSFLGFDAYVALRTELDR
jgi:putative metallohydrolase (TIGR04338 family)